MLKTKITFAALVCAALTVMGAAFTSPAAAGADPIYTGFLDNIAVQGHDPVAYFNKGAATKGSKQFATTYKGAEFHFSNQGNLDAFKQDPDKYAPQYGGYCAWAVSQGYTAKGDATHWRIVDGKLYLNYSASVQKTWETDIPGFIAKADKSWPEIVK